MALINENINEIEASVEYEYPGAGAYIGKIVKVVHEPDKQRVVAYLDIADGKFKGYGKGIEDRKNQDWGYIRSYLSYKKTALPFTVKNLNTIAESSKVNAAELKKAFNETEGQSLVGRFVGFVVGQQEYRKNNGKIGLRFQLPELVLAKDVKDHPEKFAIPELVKLKDDTVSVAGFTPNKANINIGELPGDEVVPW